MAHFCIVQCVCALDFDLFLTKNLVFRLEGRGLRLQGASALSQLLLAQLKVCFDPRLRELLSLEGKLEFLQLDGEAFALFLDLRLALSDQSHGERRAVGWSVKGHGALGARTTEHKSSDFAERLAHDIETVYRARKVSSGDATINFSRTVVHESNDGNSLVRDAFHEDNTNATRVLVFHLIGSELADDNLRLLAVLLFIASTREALARDVLVVAASRHA
mmetsp:Transcript_48759/g.114457  ORF Transcript_48759/g.114457 Transcript_48759/m.114457 type:complete len:219 (-) Transcript_48759:24-680(-)